MPMQQNQAPTPVYPMQKIENDIFGLEIPLALGTVGGLTSCIHCKTITRNARNPSARELMQFVAVAGLAQNFAALPQQQKNWTYENALKQHPKSI
jgi:hydroxymethylglutaryl-CoA reductase